MKDGWGFGYIMIRALCKTIITCQSQTKELVLSSVFFQKRKINVLGLTYWCEKRLVEFIWKQMETPVDQDIYLQLTRACGQNNKTCM